MNTQAVKAEYVEARRALLDALEALKPHDRAVVVAGAQAIYLRSQSGILPIADFTTDGDLTIDPSLLGEAPPLEALMEAAGFELAEEDGSIEPGIWETSVRIGGKEVKIPIDLIVPEGVAAPQGRRGARLGPHGKRAARKIPGMEAILVDNDMMRIASLDPSDNRSMPARVAGAAAMLVAKTHKIMDRLEKGPARRVNDKDGSDVVRLMQANRPEAVAQTLGRLLEHPEAGQPTAVAIERFLGLFGDRAGPGVELAVRALLRVMPEERVRAICLAYAEELRGSL